MNKKLEYITIPIKNRLAQMASLLQLLFFFNYRRLYYFRIVYLHQNHPSTR